MSEPFGSSLDSNNPFAAAQQLDAGPQRPVTKPTMATVFGILNIVFGCLSLLGQGFGLISVLFLRDKFEELTKQTIPMPGALQWFGTGIQLLMTFWLIYIGIRVLKGTMAGRGAFLAYCIGSLIIRPMLVAINLVAQYDQIHIQLGQIQGAGGGLPQGAVLIGLIFGGLIGLLMAEVYEAIGFFVVRSKDVTKQFEAWDEVVNGPKTNQTFDFT